MMPTPIINNNIMGGGAKLILTYITMTTVRQTSDPLPIGSKCMWF